MLTVTTPATDPKLLTRAEAQAACGVTGQDSAMDALCARVSAMIARACKVVAAGTAVITLRKETLSQTLRLGCRPLNVLVLARRPVVTVASVTVDGTALTTSDYEIDAAAGILRRLCSDHLTTWSGDKIVVAYDAGWETVPDDLKLAAVKLAVLIYAEGTRTDPNLRRESIPGVRDVEYWVSPADDPLIPAEVLQLLAPYRDWF